MYGERLGHTYMYVVCALLCLVLGAGAGAGPVFLYEVLAHAVFMKEDWGIYTVPQLAHFDRPCSAPVLVRRPYCYISCQRM